jgi:hypothetical protein
MNDQIKQLAEEAGFLLWEDEPWKPEGAIIDWSSNYDSALDKYTELIVRECASLFYLTHTDEQYQRRIDKTIKKHFGIE